MFEHNHFSTKIRRLLKIILQIILPAKCDGCGRPNFYLCESCRKEKLKVQKFQLCHICKKRVKVGFVHINCKKKSILDGLIVLVKYNKFLENYLFDIKYNFYYAMTDDIGDYIVSELKKNTLFQELLKQNVTITYVPLHKSRFKWRGFNQSQILAEIIGNNFDYKVIDILERDKNTRPQVGLSCIDRLKNVKEAFIVKANLNEIETVILVDDVYTTGATMEECALVLKSGGVKGVYGLVLARG